MTGLHKTYQGLSGWVKFLRIRHLRFCDAERCSPEGSNGKAGAIEVDARADRLSVAVGGCSLLLVGFWSAISLPRLMGSAVVQRDDLNAQL